MGIPLEYLVCVCAKNAKHISYKLRTFLTDTPIGNIMEK